MQSVMSHVDGGIVAFVYRAATARAEREGPDDPKQILQSACKRLPASKQFRLHAHLDVARTTKGTQEAWVVISGRVRVRVLDVDDTLLVETVLSEGDCLVTFRGGHGMTVLEEALLYEFKNGPYLGQVADKRFLP